MTHLELACKIRGCMVCTCLYFVFKLKRAFAA